VTRSSCAYVLIVLCSQLAGCDRVFQLGEVEEHQRLDADDQVRDAATLPPGIVAWYSMDGVESGQVADLVADRHGVCATARCPTAATGIRRGALRFDSNEQIVLVPQDTAFETKAGFTVTAWVFLDQLPASGDVGCPFSKLYGTVLNSWQLCQTSANLVFYSTGPAGVGNDSQARPSLPVGEWIHVAIRWDGTLKTIWRDGVAEPATTAMIGFDGGPIYIGNDLDGSVAVAPFPGIIDDVRIYNRALDIVELTDLAQR
jgi:hypothetical protein